MARRRRKQRPDTRHSQWHARVDVVILPYHRDDDGNETQLPPYGATYRNARVTVDSHTTTITIRGNQ